MQTRTTIKVTLYWSTKVNSLTKQKLLNEKNATNRNNWDALCIFLNMQDKTCGKFSSTVLITEVALFVRIHFCLHDSVMLTEPQTSRSQPRMGPRPRQRSKQGLAAMPGILKI